MMLLLSAQLHAQLPSLPSTAKEQQLENLAATDDGSVNDDSYEQQLDYYSKHPLNLNTASAEELSELNILSALQIQQLISYRRLLGNLIDSYELQAVPGWDIPTIKKILLFVSVGPDNASTESLKMRWQLGDATFLSRYNRTLEKARGYFPPQDTGSNYYLGSRGALYIRYTYKYKNLLQWGLLGDKDAGEQFFSGSQRMGFDFYSFHFFVRQLGFIKALAMGDFTVNFGQGLLQWQSLAFKKSAAVMNIKRQSPTLRPYNSAGEYNFHRGVGLVVQRRQWEGTMFGSHKKVSANLTDDTTSGDPSVSSIQESGYHRTKTETADKSSLQQTAAGLNIERKGDRFQFGLSAVYFHFSKPVQKSAAPYNLFTLRGQELLNAGFHYSTTYRNLHLFGEVATDRHGNRALVQGALLSLDAKADASFLYRNISRGYQSVNANAFTEGSSVVNEQGIFVGLSLRPAASIQLDAYADFFRFPWLKYRVDAPSYGADYLLQLNYTPTKRVEVNVRYKDETKMLNRPANNSVTSLVDLVQTRYLRLQNTVMPSSPVTLRSRMDMLWYSNKNLVSTSQGFLSALDVFYKPGHRHWQANGRLQYFDTDGYDERIYSYESDMPYANAIPFFYDKGFRYYCNLNWQARLHQRPSKKNVRASCWLKWAQTIYPGKRVTGSGLEEIRGDHRSEIKVQLILTGL